MKKKIEQTIVQNFDARNFEDNEEESALDLESLATKPLKFHLQTENEQV